MDIRWLDDAVDDLQSLWHFIAKDSVGVADGMVKRILNAVHMLSEQPAMGRQGRVVGTRELVITGTPYLVPYRVKNHVVEILRVFHGAKQWPMDF